jgi:hypothetical protein
VLNGGGLPARSCRQGVDRRPEAPRHRRHGHGTLRAGSWSGGRDIACVSLTDGTTKPLLSLDAIPGATGFNDLTTDAAGRIYVGSLAFRVFGRRDARSPASARHRFSTARLRTPVGLACC